MAIVLIGPAGCGAPLIASPLAARLSYECLDVSSPVATDGRTLAEIYVGDGVNAARALEVDAALAALDAGLGERVVICLPSAAPLEQEVSSRLQGHTVIYLSVDATTAAARTGLDGPRPASLLPPRPLVRAHLAATHDRYHQLAALTVDTSAMETADVVAAIIRSLAEDPAATP